MPETTPANRPGTLSWIHRDGRGLDRAMQDAFARSEAREWRNDEASTADLRALLLYALSTMAELGPTPPRLVSLSSGETWGVTVGERAPREDNAVVQGLLGLGALALTGAKRPQFQPLTPGARVRVETVDGQLPDGPTEDTSLLPAIAAVAIVSCTAVVGGVLALYFSQRNEIEATQIASSESVQKHAATLAATTSLVDAHIQRERAEQRTIPWEGKELELFESLRQSTIELAQVAPPALKTMPDLQVVSEAIANSTESVGEAAKEAAKGAGVGFGALAALAAALWVFSN